MLAVAILALNGTPDAEAPALAGDLGVTAFEAGQLVRGLIPAVVLKTDDAARAQKLVAALTARRHRALACDLKDVVRHPAMFSPRGFRLEASALVGLGAVGDERPAPFSSFRALIRATHTAQLDTMQVEKGRAFSMGRAALSGGLVLTKAVEKEKRVRSTEKEPVLYLFFRDQSPWLLTESGPRYDGLGPARLKPGRPENFLTLCRVLKEAAPQALFDERLLQFRGGPGSPNTPDTLDLLAHLTACLANG